MDILNWLLLGLALVLLAIVLVLLVRLGDERDKLQQARSDLSVFQTARADYERRLQSAEADRDNARAQVAELSSRLKVLADDAEYKEYLKTTHQLLVDFRDVRQAANELAGLRVRVENQRRQLQERSSLYQDHISLQEARHALAREQEDFEAQQRMTLADHERKVNQLQRANQDQIEALRQTHAVELNLLQEKLEARRAKLGPQEAEIREKEQSLKAREANVNSQTARLAQQTQGLGQALERLKAEMKSTRDSFAALGYQFEGDGLVCGVDWRTYKPQEAKYTPRMVINPVLTDEQQKKSFTHSEALQLIAEPRLVEWIARERRELQTPEQKLGALFEVRCPVTSHEDSLLPRSTHWVVPIIGGTSTGKTLYVTALINELRNHLPGDYAIECEPADSKSNDNFMALRKQVFVEQRIQPTQVGNPRDMVYRLAPLDKSKTRRLTILFRDIAGEYWQNRLHSAANEHGPFLLNAPCIMVLVDPLADPELRELVAKRAADKKQNFGNFSNLPTPEEIMTSVTLFLRKHGGYENVKIPKDLLMVLTKSDLLDGILYNTNDPVGDVIEPSRPLAIHQIDEMSDFIVASLRKRDALRAVVDSLPGQYKSVRWFAVSALGYPLEASYQSAGDNKATVLTQPPKPKHVTYPILRGMWLSGLLD